MGVHGLWKLIETSGKPVPLEALENKILAVDVSIWLYQLVKGFQEKAGNSVANAYLLGLFHRICKLLFYRIKPVFVFDGGVPALKRKTIAARQRNRNKAGQLSDKLRETLLENLVKQEALGKALGENVVIPTLFQPKKDSMFMLPPIPSMDKESGSDSDSEEELRFVRYRYKDLHSIDVTSNEFLALPADMRHDILTELKETRKQNSWAKLHLMPEEGGDFSSFQMQRLLKRRAVQVGLEQAESEMGTRGFTIADLETILSDQGVDLSQRIAADNSTRIIFSHGKNNVSKPESSINDSSPRLLIPKIKQEPNDTLTFVEEVIDSENEEEVVDVLKHVKNEPISQNEILQIIKQEQEDVCPVKQEIDINQPSTSALSNLPLIKTEETDNLKVNKSAEEQRENLEGNNKTDLDPERLPRTASHTQPLFLFPFSGVSVSPSSSPKSINDDEANSERKKLKESTPVKIFSTESKNSVEVLETSSQSSQIVSSVEENVPYEDVHTLLSSEESADEEFETVHVEESSDINVNVSKIVDLENEKECMEIVVNPNDEIDDDLFADVFANNSSVELTNKKTEIINIEIKNEVSVQEPCKECTEIVVNPGGIVENYFTNIKNIPENAGGPKTESIHVSSPALSNKNKNDFPHEDGKTSEKVPSPVPQLSVDEIVQMKKHLEEESTNLIKETSREERVASSISEQITIDAQELLHLFGIPYLVSPMEAEAQCAFLDLTGQTQGTITDDSDIWLFGGSNVYKNFFDQKKFVQQFKASDIFKCFHMGRDEMIMLAFLAGSDYTTGLTGVGAVTSLEVITQFPKTDQHPTPVDRLRNFAISLSSSNIPGKLASKLKKVNIHEGFPNPEVMKAYLDPLIDNSREPFTWSKPNLNELRRYTREKFGWDQAKTDRVLLPVLENLNEKKTQGTLHRFFDWKFEGLENRMSKRVAKAVSSLKSPVKSQEMGPPAKLPRPIKPQPVEPTPKSKTPAQVAREKAAKKLKELKKKGQLKK